MKIASLDVDAQKCFTPICPLELPVPEGDLIVDELNAQAQYAELRIGAKDAHPANAIWVADEKHPQLTPIKGKHVDIRWNKHAVPGELGFEFLDGLPHPDSYDFFVWKGIEPDMHPYGSCYHDLNDKLSTGLIEYLNAHHVGTIILGGLTFDYCVKLTALQLAAAGFKIIVNEAATRGIAEDTSIIARKEMLEQGIILANNAAELPQLLEG